MELLRHFLVEFQFFFLDLWNHVSAQIDSYQVEQLLVGLHITMGAFNLVSHATNIILVFEERANGFLSLVETLNVLLSGGLLLLERHRLRLDFSASIDCLCDSLEIVEFSLDPMVNVNERVAKVGIKMIH